MIFIDESINLDKSTQGLLEKIGDIERKKETEACEVLISKSPELLKSVKPFLAVLIGASSHDSRFDLNLDKLDQQSAHNIIRVYEVLKNKNEVIEKLKTKQQDLLALISSMTNSLNNHALKSKSDYQKVRDQKVVKLHNLSLHHYFKTGLEEGAEYFHYESKKGHMIDLSNLSTHNYEVSSEWLEIMNNESEKDIHERLGYKNIFSESSLCLMQFDTKSLELSGKTFGQYTLLSSSEKNLVFGNRFPFDKNFDSKASFKFQLTPGERLLLLSPSTLVDFDDDQASKLIKFCLHKLKEESWRDIADHIIMQLSRQGDYDILKKDISLLLLEVPRNAMFSIS